MTNIALTEIERRALLVPVDMTTLCAKANVAHSTITRWRGGSKPRAVTINKLLGALDRANHAAAMDRANFQNQLADGA
jgi:hypothetical protein